MTQGVLIQARLSSSRFPGKMLELLGGIPLVEFVYKRCKLSKADVVSVIISDRGSDDKLYLFCKEKNIPVFRGSLDNVLERYIKAAEDYGCEAICRVCGDTPFVDITYINEMFKVIANENYDYVKIKNGLKGFLSEVVKLQTLKIIKKSTRNPEDLEHVTSYIPNLPNLKIKVLDMGLKGREFENVSLTIDYKEDLALANEIIRLGLKKFAFHSNDIIDILKNSQIDTAKVSNDS